MAFRKFRSDTVTRPSKDWIGDWAQTLQDAQEAAKEAEEAVRQAREAEEALRQTKTTLYNRAQPAQGTRDTTEQNSGFPIAGYNEMNVSEILERLDNLS